MVVHSDAIFAGCNRSLRIFDYNTIEKIVAFGSKNTVSITSPIINTSAKSYDPTSKIVITLKNHSGEITSVKWIPELRKLISACEKGTINIWNYDDELNFTLSQSLQPNKDLSTISCIGTSLSSYNFFLAGDSHGSVFVYVLDSLNHFNELFNFRIQSGYYAMAISLIQPTPDTAIAFIGGTKPFIEVFSIDFNKSTSKKEIILSGHEDWVRSLAIKQIKDDEYLIASGSLDRLIRLWKLTLIPFDTPILIETNKLKLLTSKEYKFKNSSHNVSIKLDTILMGHEDWISDLTWKPNAKNNELSLLSSSADSSVMIWKPDSTRGIWFPEVRLGEMSIKGASTATGSSGGFYCSSWIFDADLKMELVLCNGKTGSFRCWTKNDLTDETYQPQKTLTGSIKAVTDLAWSPNGDYLLATSLDQTTRLYATWKGKWCEFGRPQIHGYDMICLSAMSETRFVSAGDEKVIRVFDMPNAVANLLSKLSVLNSIDNGENSLPENATLPVLGLSNKAESEDIEEVNEEVNNSGNNGDKGDNESDDNKKVNKVSISAHILNELKEPPMEDVLQRHTLWPEIEKMYGHGYEVTTIDVSPDGKFIASACRSNVAAHAVIRLFETDKWLQMDETLKGHDLTVTRVKFSPCGKWLLSVSRDRKFTLWERQEGGSFSLIKIMEKAHTRIIWDCCWVQSESKLCSFITCSRDKEVKLWSLNDNGNDVELKASVKLNSAVTAVDSFKVKSDGSKYKLSVGLDSGSILIYDLDVDNGKFELMDEVEEKFLPGGSITRVAFNIKNVGGSILLAVGSKDSSMRILNIEY